jgi:hypothetical protein
MRWDEGLTQRLSGTLTRFLPHVKRAAIALTGGVAIDLHLTAAGLPRTRNGIADLDFVAGNVTAVSPGVVHDFLISHYHLPQPGYPKFMVQVVDPMSRIRIDLFPDLVSSLERARQTVVAGHVIAILDARSIMTHKQLTLAHSSPDHLVDEKHQRDALVLAALLGEQIGLVPPTHLTKETYGMELSACPRCEASRRPEFPLASKQAVFDILGYN